jgi:hypothetical protein
VSAGPTFLGLLAINERYFDIELAVARKEGGGPRGGQQHHRS